MRRWLTLGIVGFCVVAAGGAIGVFATTSRNRLANDDLAAARSAALAMFPRGSRIADAKGALVGMGYRCFDLKHKVANTNAPSLTCNSNGRNFPTASELNVTLSDRNGLLTDIQVWNGLTDKLDDLPSGSVRMARP